MSPASIVLIYAALKCLHYFKLDDGPNLLNNACCRNMTEYGKRTRSLPVSKKKPVDVDIVKSIIERSSTEGSSFEGLTYCGSINFLKPS